MSTLKTHNLQSPDAGSVNIVMAPNAGIVVAGLSTYSNQINVGSNIKLGTAGVVTATSFVGGLPITSGADNRVITASSASAIQGEANLTYDGTSLKIGGDSGVSGTWHLETYNSGGDGNAVIAGVSGAQLVLQDTVSGETFKLAANGNASLYSQKGGDDMIFYTKPSGGSDTERVRISSTGYVGVGTLGHTSPTAPLSVNLGQAANNGNYFLDVKGSSTKQFGLYYDQGSWNSAEFGIHEFDNSGNASKRFTIANGGKIGINNDSPDDTLDVNGTAEITSNTYIGGNLYMYGNSYGNGVFLGGSHADNKLDYYKTGTWTPEVIDANGSNYSITYTANETRWVRIGNLVYCYYNIRNQEGGSKTGDLRLRGWPFTCKGFQVNGAYWVDHSSPSAGLGDIVGGTHYINRVSGNNVIYWVKPTDKSGSGQASTRYLAHGQWTNGRWIYGSFVYEISD